MRIGLVGSPRDLHLRRWGAALVRAGAEVWVFGLEKPPSDAIAQKEIYYLPTEPSLPYITVGKATERPNYWDFIRTKGMLLRQLRGHGIAVAHPIHLSPYGVWVYLSGFRPYIPFCMGAELEYTAWGRHHFQRGAWTKNPLLTILRQRLLPLLLRPTLYSATLILADNYTLCENIKLLCKEKKLLEIPAGIRVHREESAPEGQYKAAPLGWVLSPRGLTSFYQADHIVAGFASYWRKGGRLGLILLANLYSIEKSIFEMVKTNSKMFYEKVKIISTLLSPREMGRLWQEVVAFISAPSYDGYSYSVAEGRWAGAIPLLNAIPGNLEVGTPFYNALFIHPFTPENIANTLHALEKDLPTLQARYKARNQKWIQKFSDVDNHAKLFLGTLSQILGNVKDNRA